MPVSFFNCCRSVRVGARRVCAGLACALFVFVGIGGRAGARDQNPAPNFQHPTPNTQPPSTGGPASSSVSPDVRVEYLGTAHGYAVGTADVDIVCVVRNEGSVALLGRKLRLRCYILSGLDYTSGETMPLLPALAPGQAIAFHWRLTSSDKSSPQVVAAILTDATPQSPGAASAVSPVSGMGKGPSASLPEEAAAALTSAPRAYMAVVPRLGAPASFGSPDSKIPIASASSERAWIGNDRVAMRILAAQSHLPVLLLAAKQGTQWHPVATGAPLARILSGEDGQLPWWETFRWQGSRVRNDKKTAVLTLTGRIGSRWRAEMILESDQDTCVLQGRLRLTPLQAMRLQGVQLPCLMAEGTEPAALMDASGVAVPVAADPSPLPDEQRVVAGLRDRITFGLSWLSEAPLPGWRWERLPNSPVAPILGMRWETDEGRGELVPRGETVEFRFHLFALTPSDTVKDATRFLLP